MRAHAVTGNLIYNYFSHPCSYRVHLDLIGDRTEKCPPTPAGRYLMQRGIRHEARVFDELRALHPNSFVVVSRDEAAEPEADIERRVAATTEAMRTGARVILHGFLRGGAAKSRGFAFPDAAPNEPLVFRGESDILLRVEEPSPAFGAYGYIVADVKSSHAATFAQKMQVAFYSWILEDIQGSRPRTGAIINGLGEREDFAIDELIWTLRPFVEEEVFEFVRPERAFYHLESACESCHWREHCRARADAEDDLSLVPGCTRSAKRALLGAGIASRGALKKKSDAELRDLGRAYGMRLDGFRDLQKLASAQEFKRPVIRQHPRQMIADKSSAAHGAPCLYRHRGAYLIVAGLYDGTSGREALLGAVLRRRDEVLGAKAAAGDVLFFEESDERPAILALLAKKLEIEKLLAREPLLVLFAEGVLEHRLRQSARRHVKKRRGLGEAVERILIDAIALTDVVDRTYFLPVEARRIGEVAALLPATAAVGTYSKRPSHLEPAAGEWRPIPLRTALLERVAADYGLDTSRVLAAETDRRPILLREWLSTGDATCAAMARDEVAEDLRAAECVLAHLLKLAGA